MRAVAAAGANAVIRLLFEPECSACAEPLDRPLSGPVCARCWTLIPRLTPPLCERCGDALPSLAAGAHCHRCRSYEPAFASARSVGRYDGSLRQIVHALKYDKRRVLAKDLVRLLREVGEATLADADAVVPVPLHPWRFLQRGFNQADDLARGLGLPVWRVLRRARSRRPQAGLTADQRHANVRGAYSANFRAPRLRHRIVVLIDDVMTTGATLDACASVLKRAGAAEVRALTVARAIVPRPP